MDDRNRDAAPRDRGEGRWLERTVRCADCGERFPTTADPAVIRCRSCGAETVEPVDESRARGRDEEPYRCLDCDETFDCDANGSPITCPACGSRGVGRRFVDR